MLDWASGAIAVTAIVFALNAFIGFIVWLFV
jgi:hypothetical protein